MAFRVGITGGIGSGKSTVAKIFEVLGVPVYYADAEARRLINEDPAIISSIMASFGSESYKDGGLNRSYISELVFNDKSKLELLNAISHPPTIAHADNWMKKQVTPYALKEAALIFESGSAAYLDYAIGVYTPLPLRIQRIMHRDKLQAEEVKHRISRQMDEQIKMKLCDAVITNDEQQLLITQVTDLHQKLISLSNKG